MTDRKELEVLVARFQAVVRAHGCHNDALQVFTTYDDAGRINGVMNYGTQLDCVTAAEHLRSVVARLELMD